MTPLLPAGTRQMLVAFQTPEPERIEPGQVLQMATHVRTHFLPLGLFLRGVTSDTWLRGLRIGNVVELENSGFGRVPGSYFETDRTFDELDRLARAGELELSVKDRQVFEMQEASPGVQLTLMIEGPFSQACVWGLAYDGRAPVLEACVTSGFGDNGLDYQGTLVEQRLRGAQTLLDVTAPSEASAVTLLAAALQSPRMR